MTGLSGYNPKPFQAPGLKLKQLQHESDSWKRQLAFMTEENIFLKNRISEILKNGTDSETLAEIENFHTSFINEDELIGLLRNDIAEYDKWLERERFEDGHIISKVQKKMKELRHGIATAEAKFGKLKSDFNNYLSENIS